MKNLLLLFFTLFAIEISAQTYKELISKANSLYKEEAYQASAEQFDVAFELQEGSASSYYNAACSWALASNEEQAISYMKKSVEKGWKKVKWMQQDKDLNSLHEHADWEEIVAQAQANLDEYEKDLDKPLKNELEEIYMKDQMLRRMIGDVQEQYGRESDEMDYFWSLISMQDSINEAQVGKIIDERGWVGKSLVGGQANSALWLVIQHAPLEIQEKYLPLLKESVKKGESKGSHLALLEDRILMRNGKPQTYGSQITRDKETDKQIVYEIRDPEYVNQRRAEVGLGPIEEYVKRWDIEWTIEQKTRE
ncbi:MAG: DUF6624 domain-containing protein [Bacteroidota bacterium]